MKTFTTSVILILCCVHEVFAQNYFHQSFDSPVFPPSSWQNIYLSGTSTVGGDTVWYRQTAGSSATPSITPHSGAGMASYNSFYMDTNGRALLVTPALNFKSYTTGLNLVSFWFYKSNTYGYSGDEADEIAVYADTSAALSRPQRLGIYSNGIFEPPVASSEGWHHYTLEIPDSFSASAHVYIVFEAISQYDVDLFLDDVSVDHIAPCGTPSVSLSPSSEDVNYCIGESFTLSASNEYMPEDQRFQWQSAAAATGPWTSIAGGTTLIYTSTSTSGAEFFRLKDSCTVSGKITYSLVDTINAGPPHYASLPYTQDFESWQNYCNVFDVPGANWINTPSSGNGSWRRNDQGCSYGGWTNSCYYTINNWGGAASDNGLYCARFHSSGSLSDTAAPWQGSLDLYIDGSGSTKKFLSFSYINNPSPGYYYLLQNNDSLKVLLSTDGGGTFNQIWGADTAINWKKISINLPVTSASTIIRFLGKRNGGNPTGFGYTYDESDIGIDNIKVIPSCTSKPVAGRLAADTICAGKKFTSSLIGSSLAEDLAYQWQQSVDSLTWINIAGDTSEVDTFNFTSNSYLRAIVTCKGSGLSDTSNAALITTTFYKCYCNPVSGVTANSIDEAIGSFSINTLSGLDTTLNHITDTSTINYNLWAIALSAYGSKASLMGYTKFTDTFPPVILFLDSSYLFSIKEVFPSNYGTSGWPINVYIDYNHNGSFDTAELVFNTSGSWATLVAADTVHIPASAKRGLTGMRILLGSNYGSPLNPCGSGATTNYGEIRDYLVYIDYGPCDGLAYAGSITSTAHSICAGQSIMLTDTTHENKHSSLSWNWEVSPDGSKWTDINNTTDRDTLTQVVNHDTWYRLRMVCSTHHDTSVSAAVHISIRPPYSCYCNSAATGGVQLDSSDIGIFKLAGIVLNEKGGYLSNPAAVQSYEDLTYGIADMDIDSTYLLTFAHVLKTATGAASKVTLFIDYNNNFKYDIPQERVWSAYDSLGVSQLYTSITIPDTAIANVITGMRMVLNDDTGPNAASDDGCGTYTSGETIDFAVRFNRLWPAGVGSISSLQNLQMYPNPGDGKFNISFSSASTIKSLQISVSNMTGQQVYSHSYAAVTGPFNTQINLGQIVRGVYFVTFIADGEKMIKKMVIK